MKIEHIYSKLPVLIQNVAISVKGWDIKKTRFGKKFQDILGRVEKRGHWSHDKIIEFRNKRLMSIIRHSYDTIPYYRILFDSKGISPDDIRDLNDLKCLPIITKNDIKNHKASLLSKVVPEKDTQYIQTSGTTGSGLRFVATHEAVHELWATCVRYRRWHGLDLGEWCGYFGGPPIVPMEQKKSPFWRYNIPGKQIMFSAYHMHPENMYAYIEVLRRRRPPWLHGYPSLITLLAHYVYDKGIDIGYQIQWITIGSESLLPNQIEVIEKAFNVRPRQHYAMSEGVANISECEMGKLHVDEDFAAVEFVKNNNGPGYRIIGTNLTNRAMPFIRYDVEDVAYIESDQSCNCGRPGRIVSDIDGRKDDYIVTKDGTKHGRIAYIFKYFDNIKEAQVYQKKPGEITIRVVRGDDYNETDDKMLLKKFYERFGSENCIQIEHVDSVQRSQTGKLRLVISDIRDNKIDSPHIKQNDN